MFVFGWAILVIEVRSKLLPAFILKVGAGTDMSFAPICLSLMGCHKGCFLCAWSFARLTVAKHLKYFEKNSSRMIV